MELHTPYAFEGTVPMRVTDASAGLDLTCTLHFKGSCSLTTAEEALFRELTEEQFKAQISLSVPLAYLLMYPEGFSGLPEEIPEEKVQQRARTELGYRLTDYHAMPERFRIEKQWLSEEDTEKWDRLMQADALRDPKAKAEALQAELLTAMPAGKIRWVCACGRLNDMNFCPDCGRKKSFEKWICTCGSENSNRFCPACGKRFE